MLETRSFFLRGFICAHFRSLSESIVSWQGALPEGDSGRELGYVRNRQEGKYQKSLQKKLSRIILCTGDYGAFDSGNALFKFPWGEVPRCLKRVGPPPLRPAEEVASAVFFAFWIRIKIPQGRRTTPQVRKGRVGWRSCSRNRNGGDSVGRGMTTTKRSRRPRKG